jgi:hypothetical protein
MSDPSGELDLKDTNRTNRCHCRLFVPFLTVVVLPTTGFPELESP